MARKTTRRDAMVGAAVGLTSGAIGPVRLAQAQPTATAQPTAGKAAVPAPASFAQVTKPADGIVMPESYARAVAQETFVTCPNQDVVYGLGFFALDEQPVVVQMPDFGDRFWVYALYDGRSDQFGQLGKPYGTRPGFYLLAGPRWQGRVPAGITAVVRSATELANAIPRVFMNDTAEDRAAIRPLISQIVVYPLGDFDGRMKPWTMLACRTSPLPPLMAAKRAGWCRNGSSNNFPPCWTACRRSRARRRPTPICGSC